MSDSEKGEVQRLAGGRWAPGASANPGGRPGGIGEVRKWAREVWEEHGREALLKLALHGKREEIRLRAWVEILDRAFGRAPQQLWHGGADGGALFEPAGVLAAKLTALIEGAQREALPAEPSLSAVEVPAEAEAVEAVEVVKS
jgi:hypothetical protein